MEARCLQIVISNPDKTITLNEDVFRDLLLKPEIRDRYVAIISINGTFRQGKSFLLNFFLRYLQLKYVEKRDVTNWLKPEEGPLQGFPWSSGSRRHTTGIHMWSEVFLAELPTGEKTAILLLDTQGAFDNQSTVTDCARIFALSTLISSVQIYNVMRNIRQYELSHLQAFGGYGGTIAESGTAPFQNLRFLVRDWACAYEKPYGEVGGGALLEEVFAGGEKNATLVENVKELYEEIGCFLLPYPGRAVDASEDFNGDLNDVDESFKRHVRDFVESIVAPDKLVLKTVGGKRIKAADLIEYVTEYGNVLKEGALPEIETLCKATIEACHKAAAARALKLYKKIMDSDCKYSPTSYTSKELYHKHAVTKVKAVDRYGNIKKIEDTAVNDKYLLKLKNNMDEAFEEYQKINAEKQKRQTDELKLRRELEAFGSRSESGLATVNTVQAGATAVAVVGGIAAMAFGAWKLFSNRRRDQD